MYCPASCLLEEPSIWEHALNLAYVGSSLVLKESLYVALNALWFKAGLYQAVSCGHSTLTSPPSNPTERECLNVFAVCSWVKRAVLESEAVLRWHQDYKPVSTFILNFTASLIWFQKRGQQLILQEDSISLKDLKIYCSALLNVELCYFQTS